MYYELTDQIEVTASAEQAWAFFSQAENLPKITPPSLGFTLRNCPKIELNTKLDYTIRIAGLPIHWRTLIIDWCPPTRFVDLQIRGPYALWHHEHTFTPTDNGVLCSDRVIYRLPVPLIRRMVHPLFVKPQLLEIFRYRRKVIAENLGLVREPQDDVQIRRL